MSEPRKHPRGSYTSSEGSVLYEFDGPGDTTRRPRRPNIPRDWPPLPPAPEQKPPSEEPPTPPTDGSETK